METYRRHTSYFINLLIPREPVIKERSHLSIEVTKRMISITVLYFLKVVIKYCFSLWSFLFRVQFYFYKTEKA